MELRLTRGPGTYAITLSHPDEGEPYVPWTRFTVENTDAAVLPDVAEAPIWYAKGLGTLYIDDARAVTPVREDGRLIVRGSTSHPLLRVKVAKDDEEITHLVHVDSDGTFTAAAWAPFGPGMYDVTFWCPIGPDRWCALAKLHAFSAHDTGHLRYRVPSRGMECHHPDIVALAQYIAPRGDSDPWHTARSVYEWVCSNIRFDVEKYAVHGFEPDDGAVKTLQRRQGVCQDYTYLTVALLRAAGLPARYVVGKTKPPGSAACWADHAWTEVLIDDRWVTLDTTWGAGYMSGRRFRPRLTHKYFDPDPVTFSQTHRLVRYRH